MPTHGDSWIFMRVMIIQGLNFGEEELEFGKERGGEVDAATLKTDSPARGIRRKESEKHVAEFLYFLVGIVFRIPAGISV